jgi:hypothetical protein
MSLLKFFAIAGTACVLTIITVGSRHIVAGAIQQTPAAGLAVIALEGDQAPPELGGTYSTIESSSIAPSGEVAFSALLSGSMASSAILITSGNTTRAILRSGDTTPAGGSFSAFHELDIAGGDFLLFRADLTGIPPAEGVFLWTPQGVQTIQLAGDKTNGVAHPGLTYQSFSQLTINSFFNTTTGTFSPAFAFVADLVEDQKQAVVWKEYGENAVSVLVSGDSIVPKEIIDRFVIARLARVGLAFVADCHRGHGSREFKRPIVFAVGSSIVFNSSFVEGEHLPPIGKVRQIDVPPSVTTQTRIYVNAEFSRKGRAVTAILVNEVLLPIAALVRTGDPAPGLQDQTIVELGLPVSNPGEIADPIPPQGVVTTVRLSDGRRALWVAIVTNVLTGFTESTSLALVGGSTGEPGQPALNSFSPVKLGNNGTLLLRGAVGEDASARAGVFVLRGLFS